MSELHSTIVQRSAATPMHPLFLVDELLLQIFRYLRPGSRKSLAFLARTCNAFHGPAIEVLWGQLCNATPIIRLLPQDALSSGKVQEGFYTRIWTLTRPLMASDLVAVEKYAPLVRHLGAEEQGSLPPSTHTYRRDTVSPYAMSHLAECYPHACLFPGIRRLDWRVVMRAFTPTGIVGQHSWEDMLVYVGPELRELCINDGAWTPPTDYTLAALAELLDTVGKQCIALESLTLPRLSLHDSLIIYESLSSLVCRLSGLHTLRCVFASLSGPALAHLISSSVIQELQLGLPDRWKPWARPVDGQPLLFSSLTTIEIAVASALSYISFARSVSLPQVKSATLCLTPYPSATQLDDLFSAIGQQFSPDRLVQLRITSLVPDPSVDVTLRPIVVSSHLRSLLPFRRMQQITIDADWECGYDDDDVLGEMAEAWPGLERMLLVARGDLHARSYARSHSPSRATLRSLIPFATCCKDLKFLGIWFHADIRADHEAIEAAIAQASPNRPSPPLEILKVMDSTIEGPPERIAHFLSTLFPSLPIILANGADEHVERWREVEKLLPAARVRHR